jgi:hypothetical protein
MDPIVWAVRRRGPDVKGVVICRARDREEAKQIARQCLLGNPDLFVVEPLSHAGEAVVFHLNTEGEADAIRRVA